MSRGALLVEDNQSHAELIADELEGVLEGWDLEVAASVREARRRVRERDWDLFLLDYALPDGDGLELLRELRESGNGAPAIFVTTSSSARLAVDAMKAGADDYVVKDEGYLEILPYVVREVLERRRLSEERKAMEEKLARAQRAATLGYLASGLAHHINNPLATIRTFLQLLPSRYQDEEFRTKYYELALEETERVRDLVREIVQAARVPEGEEREWDLGLLLSKAEEGLGREIEAKKVVCLHKLPASLPRVRVQADATVCLLTTLLQNAIAFSPEGGTVEVEAEHDPEDGAVVATIKDHGEGIPPENMAKIFEPFFTTAATGLGMGLFVAARIADMQGIKLSADNRKPHGAAFTVRLPSSSSAAKGIAP